LKKNASVSLKIDKTPKKDKTIPEKDIQVEENQGARLTFNDDIRGINISNCIYFELVNFPKKCTWI